MAFYHFEPTELEAAEEPVSQGGRVDISAREDSPTGKHKSGTRTDLTLVKRGTKHPNHLQFVSIQDFGVDRLGSVPPWTCKDEVRDLVLASATTVVKILGKFVSDARPSYNYPLYHRRGQRVSTSGSGCIQSVSGPWRGLCRCCHSNDHVTEQKNYWEVRILTARHVIYDDYEASKCEVVHFDEGPGGTGSRSLAGQKVGWTHTGLDLSEVVCHTCDVDLARHLQKLCERRCEMGKRMDQREREACERGEGLGASVRQRVTELGRRHREVGEEKERIEEELREANICLRNRLGHLWIKVRDGGIEEVDRGTRQSLAWLSDGQENSETDDTDDSKDTDSLESLALKLNRTDVGDRAAIENLSDSLDATAGDGTELKSLRHLWVSRDEIKRKLFQTKDEYWRQRGEIRDIANALWSDPSTRHPPVYVISHPHGCGKHIGVGHMEEIADWVLLENLTYTAPTRPGSAGGLVLVLLSPVEVLLYRELHGLCRRGVPRMYAHSRVKVSDGITVGVSGAGGGW